MNESATATAHHLPPSDNLPLSPGFGKEYWRSIQIFAALFEFVKLCYVIVIGYTYMEYQKTTKILYATRCALMNISFF
ncbi:uncharacterized protein LOC112000446 isoform X8 [Quercus suber]|uniref:uncharacterized protein LOC112000446 isoform X8 n=1 Tax=Quercus suber TaxID=58331 RepID=UPI0032DF7450